MDQKKCPRCNNIKTVEQFTGPTTRVFKTCNRCREIIRRWQSNNKCVHNRRKNECKDCGGAYICVHNRQKSG